MAITLLTNPNRDIDGTHSSNWVAVGHPTNKALFTFEFDEITIQSINLEAPNKVSIFLDATYDSIATIGNKITVTNTDYGTFTAKITGKQTIATTLILVTDYPYAMSSTGGTIIFNAIQGNRKLRISLFNAVNDELLIEESLYPMFNRRIHFDAGAYLKPLFVREYPFVATALSNQADKNNSIPFYIKYAEVINDVEEPEVDLSSTVYYAVNAVKKAGEEYGSNMAEHVAFNANLADSDKAQFLTKFNKPTYFPGYPFGVSFLYDDAAAPYVEESFTDQNGNNVGTNSAQVTNLEFDYINRVSFQSSVPNTATEAELILSNDGGSL